MTPLCLCSGVKRKSALNRVRILDDYIFWEGTQNIVLVGRPPGLLSMLKKVPRSPALGDVNI